MVFVFEINQSMSHLYSSQKLFFQNDKVSLNGEISSANIKTHQKLIFFLLLCTLQNFLENELFDNYLSWNKLNIRLKIFHQLYL